VHCTEWTVPMSSTHERFWHTANVIRLSRLAFVVCRDNHHVYHRIISHTSLLYLITSLLSTIILSCDAQHEYTRSVVYACSSVYTALRIFDLYNISACKYCCDFINSICNIIIISVYCICLCYRHTSCWPWRQQQLFFIF